MKVIYFGCWRATGHYYWDPAPSRYGRKISKPDDCPWEHVDAALTPKSSTAHGAAALHHQGGWTALAMHDYSVDTRGNSNSVFLFDALLTYQEACEEAMRAFPEVFERIRGFGAIHLVDTIGAVGR